MVNDRTDEMAEALVTWRSALTASVLIAIVDALGPSSGILNLRGVSRPFVVARSVTILVALGVAGYLIVNRRHPRLPLARVLFVLPAFPVLALNWFLAGERAAHGLPTELFVREAIASTVYALAAPPRAIVSLVAIAAFTIESLLVYVRVRWSAEWSVPSWQLWTSLAYGGCMALLALYRAHRQRGEVVTIVRLEQAGALQRLLRSYLAVRDLVNTPLQTLRISTHLLATRCPDGGEITGSIERAVERLNELNQLLSDGESTVEWSPGAVGFDPVTILRSSRSKPES
jgi:hypothetical protein